MISRLVTPGRQGRRALSLLAAAGLLASTFAMAGTSLAAKPPSYAASLDQCRNGALADPQTSVVDCKGTGSGSSGWVNGNAGASNAHYAEGESISYRARLTGFSVGDQVTLIVGYDVIHSGVPAIDYLTDKNRWQLPETTVALHPDVPDDTVGGLTASTSTAPIPAPLTNIYVDKSKAFADACHSSTSGAGYVQQPVTSFNNVASSGQAVMEFFGGNNGSIAYVGTAPNLFDTGGDQEQQVSITFTATRSNPVIAWGGHIASRLDWGCADGPQSASGISGSPYHMRLKDMVVNGTDVNLGNQDRSLSAAAVIFANPGLTTQVKKASDDSNVANNASLSLGTAVYDTATLGGALSTAGGTVDYYVELGDSSCSIAGATSLGSKTVTNAVVPKSDNYTFTAAGTYYFWAVYSGDFNNAGATSDCTTEIVVVPKASPSFTTLASPATSIVVGTNTTVGDSASFTGGYNVSGNVSFTLFTDSNCTAGNEVSGVSGTGAVSSNSASYSTSWTPTSPGTYYWKVSYPGDANNNSYGPICGGSGETLTVIPASPGGSTSPAAQIHDTFTISGGYNPSGTVDFKLWTTSDCTGTPVDSDLAVALSGTSATSKWISVSAGTYYWSAKFNSDDTTLNNDFGPVCGEQTTVGLSTTLNS